MVRYMQIHWKKRSLRRAYKSQKKEHASARINQLVHQLKTHLKTTQSEITSQTSFNLVSLEKDCWLTEILAD